MDHFNREKKRAARFIVSFAMAMALAVNLDFLVLSGRPGPAGGIALCLAAGVYLQSVLLKQMKSRRET
ncbi:hypothetical protein [Desulfospira joergensenii]|uniref:hypothetical protein n=1 Tax=Desulfospira joergensenii TaxID=53329 RepID=UPI0003B43422|nr:hypothetical protein [Desulfospira joergensenii]